MTAGWRDAATRFRLQSAVAWRLSAVRFGIRSAALWRDSAVRFRVAPTRDAAVRFRTRATAVRDAALRFRVAPTRDTATRFRTQANATRHSALRFCLTFSRNTAARFGLQSGDSWADVALRFYLQPEIVIGPVVLYRHDWHPTGTGNNMCCWCSLLQYSTIVGGSPVGHGPYVPQMALDDSRCTVAH